MSKSVSFLSLLLCVLCSGDDGEMMAYLRALFIVLFSCGISDRYRKSDVSKSVSLLSYIICVSCRRDEDEMMTHV